MPKFKTIEQIADAYVKANRIKNTSVKKQIKRNFLSTMKNNYPEIKPDQVEFVSFDCITVVIGNELIDIEL